MRMSSAAYIFWGGNYGGSCLLRPSDFVTFDTKKLELVYTHDINL